MPTMIEEITKAVYSNVSRGLFERHKLVFSFLLSVNINLQLGKITNTQWNFLLRGPVGTKREIAEKPIVQTLTEEMWQTVNYMAETFPKFKNLPEHCTERIQITLGDFLQNIQLDTKNDNETKEDWNSVLSPFEKLMIIRALQEDKLIFAIINYISVELGKAFVESPGVSLQSLFKDTSSTVPLIFILSPGSDPYVSLQTFASEFGMMDKLQAISLGQGQGSIAEKLIEIGKEKGHWIFLQVITIKLFKRFVVYNIFTRKMIFRIAI